MLNIQEHGLILEYVESLPSPSTLPSIPHPDWISCVRSHTTPSNQSYILTTCYDGIVRVYDTQSILSNTTSINTDDTLCSGIGHISSIKHIAVQPTTINNHNIAVTTSKDRSTRIWKFNDKFNKCTQIGQMDTELVQECCAVIGSIVCILLCSIIYTICIQLIT